MKRSAVNLLVRQGIDFVQVLTFRDTVRLSSSVAKSVGPTVLPVEPLGRPLVADQRLIFNRDGNESLIDPPVVCVVAQNVLAGAEEVPVVAIPGAIGRLSFANGSVLDLTGYGVTAQYRAGAISGNMTVTVPTPGSARLYIARQNTRLIVPNIQSDDVPDGEDFLNPKKFKSGIYAMGYDWELEWTRPDGILERPVSAKMFVTAEVLT